MAPSFPAFIQVHPDGTCLRLKVQPRARRNAIGEPTGDELKVWVTAPPVDAAANEAVCHLLAEALGCRPAAIQIVRGRTSRHKWVLAAGMEPGAIVARLRQT